MIGSRTMSHAHPSRARSQSYLVGGPNHWVVDQEFADRVLEAHPSMRRMAMASIAFADSAVRRLADLGITQFLNVGSGVPAGSGAHQMAGHVATGHDPLPDLRFVHVDNDPVAVAHATLLLDGTGERGRHAVIEADLRAPDDLWADAVDTELLSPAQPVGLLLVSMLHVPQLGMNGDDIGRESVARLCARLPNGSFVVVSHIVNTGIPADVRDNLRRVQEIYGAHDLPVIWRSQRDVESVLAGFDMIDHGWKWITEHQNRASRLFGATFAEWSFASPPHSATWSGIARV